LFEDCTVKIHYQKGHDPNMKSKPIRILQGVGFENSEHDVLSGKLSCNELAINVHNTYIIEVQNVEVS
jgi:hypothetical protein